MQTRESNLSGLKTGYTMNYEGNGIMTLESFSHLNGEGHSRMVDVGSKSVTKRTAKAEAVVRLGEKIAAKLAETGGISKGNVIETARIAGIMAAKRTAELIPMCHPLALDYVTVEVKLGHDFLVIRSEEHTSELQSH